MQPDKELNISAARKVAVTLQRIENFTSDEYHVWSSSDYCKLRDLVLSGMTLFNARRGGELDRLTLTEWQEATDGRI